MPASAFAEFLQTAPGQYLLAWEQLHIDAAVADVFGYHALQLGVPELAGLRENRMPLKIHASLAGERTPSAPRPGKPSEVVVDPAEMPFASQSIDLVVMPHVLEFAAEPHQVLREVDRILVPDGQLVLTGFNPASLWGLRQMMGRLGATPYLPAGTQFIALPRLKDWLKLLSFEASRGRFGCYVPWARSGRWLDRWSFFERAGDRWWPVLGSAYLVVAVKRVRGMRLVGPVRRRREERRPVLAPAPSSVSSRNLPGNRP